MLSQFWESALSYSCATNGGQLSTYDTLSIHVRLGHPKTPGNSTDSMEDAKSLDLTSQKSGGRGRVQKVRSFPEIHVRRTQTRIPSPVPSAIGSHKRARVRGNTHRPAAIRPAFQSEPLPTHLRLATSQRELVPPSPGAILREPTTYKPLITTRIATRQVHHDWRLLSEPLSFRSHRPEPRYA